MKGKEALVCYGKFCNQREVVHMFKMYVRVYLYGRLSYA